MKWNRLFRRARRQGSETVQTLFEDDSVHKKSKQRSAPEEQSGTEQDDQQHPFLHEHHHADDRTEATHTSCSSISLFTVDSPPKLKAQLLASTVPQHIIQNNDCNSMLESPRSGTVVKFSTVEMRHYQRIVGDHPDVEIPLAIGWEFVQGPPLTVNELEEQKEACRVDCERSLRFPFTTTHGNVVASGQLLEPSRLSNYATSPKMLQRAAAFSESVRAGLLAHSKPVAAQHKDSSEIANKYLEPISLKKRIFLLRTVGGYSLKQIHQAERRRRVQIVLEWAYRKDAQDQNDPCTVQNSTVLFKRYIL